MAPQTKVKQPVLVAGFAKSCTIDMQLVGGQHKVCSFGSAKSVGGHFNARLSASFLFIPQSLHHGSLSTFEKLPCMEKNGVKDVEAGKPARIPFLKMIFNQGALTDDIINHAYRGAGTEEDPYIVEWLEHDPRNPMRFPEWFKWTLTMLVAIATLAVAFVSSAYSGGVEEIAIEFGASSEFITLGISLFVLGFALGPLLWAPLSELYGRQILFFGTYAMLTIFNAGAASSQNIQTLIILRFFAGAFGSSPLTNAGGVIADMFSAEQRGIAMSLFAAAPFMGPVLGPIVGGFVGETVGWRWVEGVMAIFTGVLWLIGGILIPETYAPVLLRKRANALSKLTGKVYKSRVDAEQGKVSIGHAFKTSLSRPWVLLFREPIVLLLSIYMAIIYGTLYMMFGAFPIVYQQGRGWSPGIGGLAFIGVMVGMLIGVAYALFDNKRYVKAVKDNDGFAPPEARLPPGMVGGLAIPIGLFWFAWTNSPSIHWIVSILAGVPFGFGMVLVFLAIMNYLIDAYVIFAASVLAANSVIRSLFGAAFPLFTSYMYQNLGIHWASSIPAFLALACVPFPFLFYKYGPAIRVRCKFAKEADEFLRRMRAQDEGDDDEASSGEDEKERASNAEEKERRRELEEDREQEAFDYSYDDETNLHSNTPGFERIKTGTSMKRAKSNGVYEANPFDLDRTNTRESFGGRDAVSRASSREGSLKSKKSIKSMKSGSRR
ncbi:hypothetical protein FH972_021712 [Carpinus fangiana]|uniref:Major facilitator superfamily (MFS) profile domain-containing protein n=1 Tax=Carpinus fangiana TaxID=176857 RepID=A0A5N6KQG7_9ROSI|nr:hypothetical protein FH972_021712 [Carpinus fangiana]